MKLSDLKETTVTHKEFDSVTDKILGTLHDLFNVDELVDLAKDSPYLQDRARLDNAIHNTMDRLDIEVDPSTKKNIVQRIKRVLGA